jgi:hypothetical protein
LATLTAQVRRLHLAEVIHAARVNGWTVTDANSALYFVSKNDDELRVSEIDPDPVEVARELENLAPHDFRAKSIPFVANVGSDAAVARATAERLENTVIPDLQLRLVQQTARAALADVAAEASANGWEVQWGEDSAYFERGG